MNRLKQLRKEKGTTQGELSEALKVKGLYIAKQEINAYEIYQLKMHNDVFWSHVANYFNVTLTYLKGESKIPNEDYIIELQDVLHENFELKKEINFLTDENQRLINELYESNTILDEFRKELHIDS
ncbi:helix-turn-helix domain-containing protein [Streptococcus iniae]|uniref:helix-turn-helix domain-containing protein n=1 Tax=Streptococcus iniae TaxID=1346 RepID=UPI00217DE96B|nr:helix-turn-helix transcriptional regulator [Streptococcus iniae]